MYVRDKDEQQEYSLATLTQRRGSTEVSGLRQAEIIMCRRERFVPTLPAI
jgi:hypothetical protein